MDGWMEVKDPGKGSSPSPAGSSTADLRHLAALKNGHLLCMLLPGRIPHAPRIGAAALPILYTPTQRSAVNCVTEGRTGLPGRVSIYVTSGVVVVVVVVGNV